MQKKSAAFDPTKFEDHHGTALKERPEVLRVFVPKWAGVSEEPAKLEARYRTLHILKDGGIP
jgi:hypothetical protein